MFIAKSASVAYEASDLGDTIPMYHNRVIIEFSVDEFRLVN